MSVLIKGMKMPRGCDECYIRERDTCPLLKVNVGEWGRLVGCPLVELPDHGDLIDIEVLRALTGMRTECSECKHCGLFGCKGDISTDYICGVLDDMPVVIPAERSEDGET